MIRHALSVSLNPLAMLKSNGHYILRHGNLRIEAAQTFLCFGFAALMNLFRQSDVKTFSYFNIFLLLSQ